MGGGAGRGDGLDWVGGYFARRRAKLAVLRATESMLGMKVPWYRRLSRRIAGI